MVALTDLALEQVTASFSTRAGVLAANIEALGQWDGGASTIRLLPAARGGEKQPTNTCPVAIHMQFVPVEANVCRICRRSWIRAQASHAPGLGLTCLPGSAVSLNHECVIHCPHLSPFAKSQS